jgi:hypothetical protein
MEPTEIASATSTQDPTFRERAYASLKANGEVLVAYYPANGGGWQEWHLVRNRGELDALLESGSRRSLFDVYTALQLPVRGVADAAREAALVSVLKADGEVAMATLARGRERSLLAHLGTVLNWGGTDDEAEVHEWFRLHAGEEIIAGSEPSLAKHEALVLSARVPDVDGKIRRAAF